MRCRVGDAQALAVGHVELLGQGWPVRVGGDARMECLPELGDPGVGLRGHRPGAAGAAVQPVGRPRRGLPARATSRSTTPRRHAGMHVAKCRVRAGIVAIVKSLISAVGKLFPGQWRTHGPAREVADTITRSDCRVAGVLRVEMQDHRCPGAGHGADATAPNGFEPNGAQPSILKAKSARSAAGAGRSTEPPLGRFKSPLGHSAGPGFRDLESCSGVGAAELKQHLVRPSLRCFRR